MIKSLVFAANNEEMDRIVTARGNYADHPLFGNKPLFVSWDSIVDSVQGAITLSSAPRPTLQDRLDDMHRSEVTYVIYVIENASRHFIPITLISVVDFFIQVLTGGKRLVLKKSEVYSST